MPRGRECDVFLRRVRMGVEIERQTTCRGTQKKVIGWVGVQSSAALARRSWIWRFVVVARGEVAKPICRPPPGAFCRGRSSEQATILGSTLALGKTVPRAVNPGGNGYGVQGAPGMFPPSAAAPGAAATAASAGGGDALSMSAIFDDDWSDDVRSLKTLTR